MSEILTLLKQIGVGAERLLFIHKSQIHSNWYGSYFQITENLKQTL